MYPFKVFAVLLKIGLMLKGGSALRPCYFTLEVPRQDSTERQHPTYRDLPLTEPLRLRAFSCAFHKPVIEKDMGE